MQSRRDCSTIPGAASTRDGGPRRRVRSLKSDLIIRMIRPLYARGYELRADAFGR